jgi:hypothetical protein
VGDVSTAASSGAGASRRSLPLPLAIAVAVAAGVAVGVLTSFGQTHLHRPFDALCNSASAWLVAPFIVGALMRTRRGAAAAGLTTCALQVVAYYATAHARGYATSRSLVAFWIVCAIVGGPLFGFAGQLWRNGSTRFRGLGGTALAAAFAAEGLWVYHHQLHYNTTATLWLAIAAGILVIAAPRPRELRWFALTLPVGLLGEIAVSVVYRHTFG